MTPTSVAVPDPKTALPEQKSPSCHQCCSDTCSGSRAPSRTSAHPSRHSRPPLLLLNTPPLPLYSANVPLPTMHTLIQSMPYTQNTLPTTTAPSLICPSKPGSSVELPRLAHHSYPRLLPACFLSLTFPSLASPSSTSSGICSPTPSHQPSLLGLPFCASVPTSA